MDGQRGPSLYTVDVKGVLWQISWDFMGVDGRYWEVDGISMGCNEPTDEDNKGVNQCLIVDTYGTTNWLCPLASSNAASAAACGIHLFFFSFKAVKIIDLHQG